jgi:hypothetical protein
MNLDIKGAKVKCYKCGAEMVEMVVQE